MMHAFPTCPICIESFDDFANIAALACGHTFHYDCITDWAEKSKEEHQPCLCPTCKVRFKIKAACGVIKKLYFTFDSSHADDEDHFHSLTEAPLARIARAEPPEVTELKDQLQLEKARNQSLHDEIKALRKKYGVSENDYEVKTDTPTMTCEGSTQQRFDGQIHSRIREQLLLRLEHDSDSNIQFQTPEPEPALPRRVVIVAGGIEADSYSSTSSVQGVPYLSAPLDPSFANEPCTSHSVGRKTTQQVSIRNDLAGPIIGPSGTRIRAIRAQSGAQIIIDSSGNGGYLVERGERVITITGTEDQIQNALYLMQLAVRKHSGRP